MGPNELDPRRTLLEGLIDYAGLFPPARLTMADAVREYLAAKRGPFSWMLERFICPASRLTELRQVLGEAGSEGGALGSDEKLRLALVVDGFQLGDSKKIETELPGLLDSDDVEVELLELRLVGKDETAPLPADVIAERVVRLAKSIQGATWTDTQRQVFVELPLNASLQDTLAALAEHKVGAKVRCGGVAIDSAPTPQRLTPFIAGCAQLSIPWKATAGLHHPFRHLTRTGRYEHGFINLLTAAGLATLKARESDIEAALADEDHSHFTFDSEGLHWKEHHLGARGRELFVAYGSCSFEEPTTDLVAMGVPLSSIGSDSSAVIN